jgi:Tol biopolymer transport system component
MKKALIFVVMFAVCILPQLSHAATFDPSRQWMTIKTPHYFIRYADENEYLAKRAAVILEEAYEDLTVKYDWKPWGRTEVVFVDSADIANGMASVLPYNWVLLYAAPPLPDSTLGYYDDWLRILIYHEMQHIFHLDAARGWWKAFRIVFGKTVAPAGLAPAWVKEGQAVYVESAATKSGRARSSFTQMMLRTAMLENRFPTISQGDGIQWSWPTSHIPYLFGGEFIDYLVDRYGFDKLMAFNDRTQRTMFISMVNYAARTVYGKTFWELWREWEEYLKGEYEKEKEEISRQGLTHTDVKVPMTKHWEEYVAAPAISPDGYTVAYTVTSPHHSSELRFMDLETRKISTFVKKKAATQIGWHPTGDSIVFSALGSAKKSDVYVEETEYDIPMNKTPFEVGILRDIYYDVWEYSFEKGELKRLTTAERARDPDYSPDGKKVVYIARDDKSVEMLKLYDLEKGKGEEIKVRKVMHTRFANPRFSPDGKWIAVTGWDPKNMWKVYLYSVNGKKIKRLTKAKRGVELRPWWTPDGMSVLYSSDASGVANIYKTNIKSGKTERLTNVLSGAFQPTTRDGRTVAIQYYTSRGFELRTFQMGPAYKDSGKGAKLGVGSGRGEAAGSGRITFGYKDQKGHVTWPTPKKPDLELEPEKYSPFGKSLFLPRYIVPTAAYTQDNIFIAAAIGGNDALKWHNWMAGISYMTGANYVGYFARYWYNRFKTVFGLGINDYVVNYGQRTFILDDDGDPATDPIVDTRQYWEKRRSSFIFVTYPYGRHAFSLSYNFEQRNPAVSLLPWQRDLLTLGRFAGFNFVYAYSDAEMYRASMIIFVGDWREYIRLWHHHVLAFRVMGGITWGDELAQGTFVVGGALGEGTLARQSSLTYFPLRGLPTSALGATRAMLFSMEYRIPLFSPQRGLGTWPIAMQNAHMALFADYGDGWLADQKPDSIRDFFDNFFLGVGLELRGDFVIGHGLPVKGRLGYGVIVVNRDRILGLKDPILKTAAKYGVLILELGTSF